jgi:dienelactone hydrolase
VANRSQLLHLAQVLAAAGGEVYVVDLPGRGDNLGAVSERPANGPNATMPTPNETRAATAVIHYINRRFGVRRDHLVLVGHSMGGGVALDIAHRIRPAATVSLAGLERPVSPGNPPNALFITARFDIPALQRAADKMYEQTRRRGQATRRQYPAIHSSLPFHAPVQQAIVDWANRAVFAANLEIPGHFNEWLLALEWTTLLFLAALFIPLAGLTSWALAGDPHGEIIPETPVSLWTPWRLCGYSLLAGITVVLALALPRWLGWPHPLGFLRLADGDYLASVLLLSTLWLIPTLRRRPWVREWRATATKVVVTFPLAAYIVLAGATFLTWQLYDIWPTPGRLARALLLAVVLLPYALGEELLVRTYAKQATGRALSGLLLWRLGLLLAILLGVAALNSGAGLLLLMTVPLAALSVVEFFFSSVLYRALGSAHADALLKAILLGWFIATVFPLR